MIDTYHNVELIRLKLIIINEVADFVRCHRWWECFPLFLVLELTEKESFLSYQHILDVWWPAATSITFPTSPESIATKEPDSWRVQVSFFQYLFNIKPILKWCWNDVLTCRSAGQWRRGYERSGERSFQVLQLHVGFGFGGQFRRKSSGSDGIAGCASAVRPAADNTRRGWIIEMNNDN